MLQMEKPLVKPSVSSRGSCPYPPPEGGARCSMVGSLRSPVSNDAHSTLSLGSSFFGPETACMDCSDDGGVGEEGKVRQSDMRGSRLNHVHLLTLDTMKHYNMLPRRQASLQSLHRISLILSQTHTRTCSTKYIHVLTTISQLQDGLPCYTGPHTGRVTQTHTHTHTHTHKQTHTEKLIKLYYMCKLTPVVHSPGESQRRFVSYSGHCKTEKGKFSTET